MLYFNNNNNTFTNEYVAYNNDMNKKFYISCVVFYNGKFYNVIVHNKLSLYDCRNITMFLKWIDCDKKKMYLY